MKKIIFFFACLTIAVLGAQVNAQVQTIVSATADIRYCFNNSGEETVDTCGTQFIWKDARGLEEKITCTHSGDWYRYTTNSRGCDSTATLHLTLSGVSCLPQGVPSKKTVFSVSGNKKVYFSQGNLVWSESGQFLGIDGYMHYWSYKFADYQYQYGSYLLQAYYGSDPYGICYFGQNLSSVTPCPDYGRFCSITNGGNEPGLWRTLSTNEWQYLFSSRTNASSKRAWGSVANINGVILLPDEWDGPYAITGSQNVKTTFTADEWKGMETNGAIFLPAGGYYDKSMNQRYFDQTTKVYCWTETGYVGGFSYDPQYYVEYILMQNSSSVTLGTERFDGWRGCKSLMSVRLVMDVPAE